jgi:hypothetical protein
LPQRFGIGLARMRDEMQRGRRSAQHHRHVHDAQTSGEGENQQPPAR